MKTIFAAFTDYNDAQQALDALYTEGFQESDINVFAESGIVEGNAAPGENEADGVLGELLSGHQAISMPDVGEVLAIGELFTIFGRAAADPSQTGGLVEALVEASVPQETARLYVKRINSSGLLLAVRTEDDRASSANNVLQRFNGQEIGSYV